MRVSVRFGVVLLTLIGLATTARNAGAVTPEDLLRLKQSGLGDEVLLALVDTTGVQGRIDPDFAVVLSDAGLGQRVIAAAIRSGASEAAGAEAIDSTAVAYPVPDTVQQEYTPAPQVVIVPWVVARPRHAGRAIAAKPTFANGAGVGRFINTYFHPLNDGTAPASSPSRSSQAPQPH